MGSLTQEIDEQIKRALSIVLLKNITASGLCSHFADQPSKKRAFNQQEIEILSRGTGIDEAFLRISRIFSVVWL